MKAGASLEQYLHFAPIHTNTMKMYLLYGLAAHEQVSRQQKLLLRFQGQGIFL
tara:strand:+ start:182890 stop:183048 length:159 start_codon:yes stop_codon:yes gene_type:complete